MNTRLSMSILLFGLLTLCTPFALAQQDTATITGEVKDASGGCAEGNDHRHQRRDEHQREHRNQRPGLYTVPSLRPGDYTITVEKSGFNKTLSSGVTLQVNQFARVDITLQAGQVTKPSKW